jgi:hypothetical protein
VTLLSKLAGQYSALVMFTHSAGTAISLQTSQMLRELAMRANIVHEHLDVQCPTQIIGILRAASLVLCSPLSPETGTTVRRLRRVRTLQCCLRFILQVPTLHS